MHLLLALALALSGHQTAGNAATSNVLTWADSNSAGTVTWSMQRSATGCVPAGFATIATGLTAMTYTDGNLNPGTIYSYQVVAVRTSDSAVSAPSNCITMVAPPNAPTGLKFAAK